MDPGFGFVTEICTLPSPGDANVPLAVTSEEETNFVARTVEPKFTTAPFTKDAPERVSVNSPTFNFDGETEESCGMGFSKFAVVETVREAFDAAVAWIVTAAAVGTLAGAV
jgi:hypothetical protein